MLPTGTVSMSIACAATAKANETNVNVAIPDLFRLINCSFADKWK